MMKHIHSIIKLWAIIPVITVVFSSCGDDIEGTFYISDAARKYQTDTNITSFTMVDNYGISDMFFLDQSVWYTTHNYFSEWGTDGKAWGETYGVAYYSSLNDFFFMFVLRADEDHTDLEVEWNQTDRMVYNLAKGKIESGTDADVKFYDSLAVRDIMYYDIIEIDYSDNINNIDDDTPVITYISGDKGLIKFTRKDDVCLERID